MPLKDETNAERNNHELQNQKNRSCFAVCVNIIPILSTKGKTNRMQQRQVAFENTHMPNPDDIADTCLSGPDKQAPYKVIAFFY